MSTPETKAKTDTPFHRHELYRLATRHLAEGKEAEAIQQLRLLAEIYPEERGLQDMLMRVEMKAALADLDKPVAQRRQAPAALRRLLTILLTATVALMAIAGFAYLYREFVGSARLDVERDIYLNGLRQDCQDLVKGGDWEAALQQCQQLLAEVPGDSVGEAALPAIERGQRMDNLYVEARAAEERDDYPTALDLYRQLHAQDPTFRDVEQRIVTQEKLVALEAAWQAAQPCIQAQDWPCMIDRLTAIYKQDQRFRDPEVKNNLIRAYTELAKERIAQASGDIGVLRQATDLLDEAFRLGLSDPLLRTERDLADQFVRGADAYNDGDWERALTYWRRVYETNPDYQAGLVRQRLREIAPEVARGVIAQANGDVARLSYAIDTLNLAIELQPDAQDLIQERSLAEAFIAGALAFAQKEEQQEPDYCGAMDSWGPVYVVRPDYQNGVLEEGLRQACERCRFPDETVCSPTSP
jgi:tetratricopeptide (TPR) repeat protein